MGGETLNNYAIKKYFLFSVSIFVLSFLACSKSPEQNSLFEHTYIDVLTNEVFIFRNIRPPNPEEFAKGIRGPLPSIRDTINPLRLYVQKQHLEVNFNDFNKKLPVEYKFALDTLTKLIDYLPKNIEEYSIKDYEFIEVNNLNGIIENKLSDLNYGGILQFSKVLINSKKNKGLLFIRRTYDQLDSVESLIFLEKNNGKWEVLKSLVISFA